MKREVITQEKCNGAAWHKVNAAIEALPAQLLANHQAEIDKVIKLIVQAEREEMGEITTGNLPTRLEALGKIVTRCKGAKGNPNRLDLGYPRRRWCELSGVITKANEKTETEDTNHAIDTGEQKQPNPLAGLNVDDPRLKRLSGDARLMLAQMETGDNYFHILRAKAADYQRSTDTFRSWDTSEPPSDRKLLTLIASMVTGKVSQQHINDVFKKIAARWKGTVTAKILKTQLEVCRYILENRDRNANNKPEIARAKVVIVNEDHFLDQVQAANEGLRLQAEKTPTLFRFGTELASIGTVPETGAVSIEVATRDAFQAHLSETTPFYHVDAQQAQRGVHAPLEVTKHLFVRTDLPLPYLEKVVVYPSFDADGVLQDQPGYIPSAFAYYAPPDGFEMPRVSATPGPEDVAEAKRLLVVEYLADFPFDGYTRREIEVAMGVTTPDEGETPKAPPPSLLSFLAFLFQTPCRSMIGRSPMPALLVTKPKAGSGATKLMESAQILLLGATSTRPSIPKEEEERRKQITAALLSGAAFLPFDNVRGAVDSQVLATLLTSTTWTDRILGRSSERSLPNLASTSITGNNPKFSDELVRRLSLCRIDPGVPDPENRQDFRHPDLEEWVSENRGKLMWALCTLAAHWVAGGREKADGPALQSFVPWYHTVGGILKAAGWDGFQSNRAALKNYASADEGEPILSLIQAWYDDSLLPKPGLQTLDGKPSKRGVPAYAGPLASFCDGLGLALPVNKRSLDGERQYDPRSMGMFLSEHAGQVFEVSDPDHGKQLVALVMGEKTKHGKPWILEDREVR